MSSQPLATILVIEDHKEFQDLVKALLESEGYSVIVGSTSAAALAALEMLQPSLILLDSSLPDGDGIQLAQTIRDRKIESPIVLMTTDTHAANLVRGITQIEILTKPFSTVALLSTIRTRLGDPTAHVDNVRTGQMGGASRIDPPTRELSQPPAREIPAPEQPTPVAPAMPAMQSTGQWEYCQLIAAGRAEKRGETYYSVDLIFLGATVTSRQIASREGPAAAPWTTNPWKQAIGMLGLAGWEMVNIQHGDYAGRAAEGSTLSWNTVVAYFRRPVLPNRPITEPKISLTRT